jgi:hypothetical protein
VSSASLGCGKSSQLLAPGRVTASRLKRSRRRGGRFALAGAQRPRSARRLLRHGRSSPSMRAQSCRCSSVRRARRHSAGMAALAGIAGASAERHSQTAAGRRDLLHLCHAFVGRTASRRASHQRLIRSARSMRRVRNDGCLRSRPVLRLRRPERLDGSAAVIVGRHGWPGDHPRRL